MYFFWNCMQTMYHSLKLEHLDQGVLMQRFSTHLFELTPCAR